MIFGERIEWYANAETDWYGAYSSNNIAFHNVFCCILGRCVAILIVKCSVVCLVYPLPEDRVDRSRRCKYEAKADWNIHRQEWTKSKHPIYDLSSIGMYRCWHHSLSDSYLSYLSLGHQYLSCICLIKLSLFRLLLFLDQPLHWSDSTIRIECMQWVGSRSELFKASPERFWVKFWYLTAEHDLSIINALSTFFSLYLRGSALSSSFTVLGWCHRETRVEYWFNYTCYSEETTSNGAYSY